MKTLQIIYEDPHLIAINKSAGQLVIPGRGEAEEKPLVSLVSSHIRKKAYVVHRIDRETSGLVVFAKDAQTHKTLSGLWEGGPPSLVSGRKERAETKASADSHIFDLDVGRKVHKTYLAWVKGQVAQKEGLLDYPLKTFGSGRIGVDPKGKPSQTRYRFLKGRPEASLLEIEPLTGRRHQIRVHLYQAGHPVLGDPLYGSERPVGGAPRLMLHAYRLEIPLSERTLKLVAEPPPEFEISQ